MLIRVFEMDVVYPTFQLPDLLHSFKPRAGKMTGIGVCSDVFGMSFQSFENRVRSLENIASVILDSIVNLIFLAEFVHLRQNRGVKHAYDDLDSETFGKFKNLLQIRHIALP